MVPKGDVKKNIMGLVLDATLKKCNMGQAIPLLVVNPGLVIFIKSQSFFYKTNLYLTIVLLNKKTVQTPYFAWEKSIKFILGFHY